MGPRPRGICRCCAAVHDCLFSNRNFYFVHLAQRACIFGFEWALYLLGPCLIVAVIALATCESYWVLALLLPLIGVEPSTPRYLVHAAWVAFLVVNTMFNYFSCVCTNPGTHDSPLYRKLVRDAAQAGTIGISDWENYVHLLSSSSWVNRGPFEWGFCKLSRAPKAPRAHFDHVTKKLVLNMDHYCPWMFNVVGYANYRYFVNFLIWITVACVYGVALTLGPFLTTMSKARRRGLPMTQETRNALTFTFVLAVPVGCAVGALLAWHVYLICTAQTTIEFYGNYTLRTRARAHGRTYQNPYDAGSARKNFAAAYGPAFPLLAILPSWRPPAASPPWDGHQEALLRPAHTGPEIV